MQQFLAAGKMLARGKPGKRAAARVEYVGWVEVILHVIQNCVTNNNNFVGYVPRTIINWCVKRTLVLSPRSEFDGIISIETV